MLKVWCVFWGAKYSVEYVHTLKRMVQRNLHMPHQFWCLTDQVIDGINTYPQQSEKEGWWQKLDLLLLDGENLYLDLDVVVTGSLDTFVGTNAEIKVCKNWACSGHGGCQSSVMYWDQPVEIVRGFDYAKYASWPPSNIPPKLWGDQEVLTMYRDSGDLEVEYFSDEHVRSYKYHLRGGLTPGCKVAIFHGKPDPHEVEASDKWVKEHRA